MKRKRESDTMDHYPQSAYPRRGSSNASSSQRTSSDSSAHWDAPPTIEISEVESIHSAHEDRAAAHSPPPARSQQLYAHTSEASLRHSCVHPPLYSEGPREGGEEEMEVELAGDVGGGEKLETAEHEQRLRKRDYAIQMTRIMGRQLVSGISRGSRRETAM